MQTTRKKNAARIDGYKKCCGQCRARHKSQSEIVAERIPKDPTCCCWDCPVGSRDKPAFGQLVETIAAAAETAAVAAAVVAAAVVTEAAAAAAVAAGRRVLYWKREPTMRYRRRSWLPRNLILL